MYRLNIGKLQDLDDFLSENLSGGMVWAVVHYGYISLRRECVQCFRTEEEAHLNTARPRNEANPSVVPLQALQSLVSFLNKHQSDKRIRIYSLSIDVDRIYENWIQKQKEFITKKTNFMNEQNFQYLKDNIKYLGFGENHDEALKANLGKDLSDFSIAYKTEINKKPFEATLHFRKSDSSDLYFLNSYSASLQRSNGEKAEQTFYLNKGKGVTAKEAYNLLEGRAVFKELSNKQGQHYKAWMQIDFANKDKHGNHEMKQYHENYGYDLKAAVAKYYVAELNNPDKEKALMQSLEKGNVQSITIEKDGAAHKMFIEANPQYKTVNLYDARMKRVQKESIGMYQAVVPTSGTIKKEEQSHRQDQKIDKKLNIQNSIEAPGKTKSKANRKSMRV